MKDSVGFIGGGRVVRILLGGWAKADQMPARVVVTDPNREALDRLAAEFPTIDVTSGVAEAAGQDIVFLATHPPALAAAAVPLASQLRRDAVLVSLAPKWTLARLAGLLGGFCRIARVIPNAPSVIGAGFNPIAWGPALPVEARARIVALFAPLGDCPEVAEETLEAYAVCTAMGPTYLWFQLQALREVAISLGLTESEANHGLKRMTCGAVRTLFDAGRSPAEVADLVPVKPLAEMEPVVLDYYRTRLPAIHEKIKP
ncbi:MAG: NAD(P)-binding domain-containing protein [Verrucomicrobia bacterium]|nr:NAD(P)-binding domain-containing protein [Verrucomicrobiota bacterium]